MVALLREANDARVADLDKAVELTAAFIKAPADQLRSAAAEPSNPGAVFVDCSRSGSAGSGSRLDLFSALAQVNALTLAPGTSVQLKRGSTGTGTLAPRGSGTSQQPITIASYGEPAAPKARISDDLPIRLSLT
ncbi:hypothetical protein ABZ807_30955 [Micromonospora sp. NPDC047548]|uniref:hypothetical protein n=1 Tax=Micromonospora sp. NPDC047548 TaxID=3155624 RepID=UPI0033F8B943